MNIRPLESLTKDELIELVKHEREHIADTRKMVSDGWKLVPVEPTFEMLKEIHINEHFTRAAMEARYTAMLAAAPHPDHIPDVTKMVEPTDTEMLDLLIEMRRELQACQAIINLAGFNTPSSASAALAAINKADIVIKAMRGEE